MAKKAIIIKDKFNNQLYPATYKDDEGNVIKNHYQEKLVSSVNIKTINNQSLLGSGNIPIEVEEVAGGNISGDIEDQTDLMTEIDSVPNFLEYANMAAFPPTGVANKLYLATDTKKIYKGESTAYVEVSPAPEPTGVVVGSSEPTNHNILWINTTKNNGLYYYNGTNWVSVPVLFG